MSLTKLIFSPIMNEASVNRKRAIPLVVASLIIYAQVVGFGLIDQWDDALYFLERTEVVDWFGATWRQRLLTPETGYPTAIPTFLHWLTRQLQGALVVPTAHSISVVFHLANVLISWRLVSRWTNENVGLIIAMIWAVHPIHAETVAWITNLKFVSMTTFILAALMTWERVLDGQARYGWATVFFAILALFCQPQSLAMAPAMLARAFARQREGLAMPDKLRGLWPVLAVAGLIFAYFPLALSGQHELLAGSNQEWMMEMTLSQRFERIGLAAFLQFRNFFWPVDLQPIYHPTESASAWMNGMGWAILALATLVTLTAVWRRRPSGSFFLVAGTFYVPVSGLDFLPRLTADAYAYLPSLFVIGALVVEAATWVERVELKRQVITVCVGSICMVLGGLATFQAQRWENTVSLIRPTLTAAAESPFPYRILGRAYFSAGMHERSLKVFESGQDIMNSYGYLPVEMALAYEQVGKPHRAASLLTHILNYPGEEQPDAEAHFLRIFVQYRLGLPSSLQARERSLSTLAQAVRTSMHEFPPEFRAAAAEHFRSLGVARRIRGTQ